MTGDPPWKIIADAHDEMHLELKRIRKEMMADGRIKPSGKFKNTATAQEYKDRYDRLGREWSDLFRRVERDEMGKKIVFNKDEVWDGRRY